jgi:hypothetical protein
MVKSLRYHRCCSWVSSFWGIPSAFQRWQFLRIWNRSVDITKFLRIARVWQMFCSEFPFYHSNYWPTDWLSMLHYRITSKDSTDTFIEQVQFKDSHRFFWKWLQKANCLSVYANEQSDRLLARPLSDKSLPTWPSTHPFSDKASPDSYVIH